MDEPINADEFKGKVKMHYHNDPKKVRYFTPNAVESVKPLWVLAEDQSLPEGVKKKSPVAAPVASVKVNEDVLKEARQRYEEIAGESKRAEYMTWTAPRLFIEAATLKKQKAQEAKETPAPDPVKDEEPKTETPASETKEGESEEKPAKRKYTKREKKTA